MQFYRRWYSPLDLYIDEDTNKITDSLSTWGFVELDGSPLKKTYYGGGYGSQGVLKCRWRYDTDTRTCFSDSVLSGTTGSQRFLQYVKTNFSGGRAFSYAANDSYYANLIFIPLKNRGFLISSNSEDGSSPDKRSQPPELHPFCSHYRVITAWNAVGGCINFYNNIDNNFNLGYFSYNGDGNNLYNTGYFGFDIGNYDWKTFLYSTGLSSNHYDYQYDYKSNICTLIKHPYNNGFLSNLFLITTSPLPFISESTIGHCGLWGKFFSFGGRNFYCPMANLAIELPSN